MSYQDICNKIDELMTQKFKDINNYTNINYKKSARELSEYFDNIGEKEAEKNFPRTFSIKEHINYNVIYDEKTRRNFSELEKSFSQNDLFLLSKNEEVQNIVKKLINNKSISNSFFELEKDFGIEIISLLNSNSEAKNLMEKIISDEKVRNICIHLSNLENNENILNNLTQFDENALNKIFSNPNVLKSILKGDLSDTNYKSDKKTSNSNEGSFSSPTEVTSDNKSISIAFNSEITKNENMLNFYKSSISSFLKYGNDFDFDYQNTLNLKTGITGEAYIYELLLNSGEFKNVKWNMINEAIGENFEYNGKKYKIFPDGSHFDILVETKDDHKIYIEVKSTKYEFGNKVPFYLSQKQIEMMNEIKPPNEYALAIVFDTLNNPKHFFMNLRKKIINNN